MLTGAVVLVLAGAGAGAWALVNTSGPGYQVATAGLGDVQQTLDLTGTVQPVDEATLDFQVSGKVAAVDVTAGQSVTSGEVLASLDASSLQAAVSQDESTLSADQDKLATDESSESSDPPSSSSSTGSSASSGSGATSAGSSDSGSGSGSLTTQIASLQQQLVADQHTVDTMETQEASDLQSADSACQSSGGSGGSGGSGSTSESASCSAALSQVLTDQQQEASDLAAVSQDETALSKLLSEEESAIEGSGTGSGSHGSGSSGSGTTETSSVATPATIASDQAAIDAVQAQLDEAQQSLDEAQLTTPLSGVVAAVNLTVDQNVSAGSTSADIVVQGPTSFEVVGDIALTDLSDVQVGNAAEVVPDGSTDALSGTVSAVSNMPSSSDSSSGDYQVTVSLPANVQGLYNGSNAEVSIVTGQARHVLTVPTSAVHALGREDFVDVLDHGTSKLTVVGIGAMGDQLTQITSGLTAGESVILADLAEPLPTGTSTGPGGIVSLEGGGGFVRFSGGGGFRSTRIGSG